MNSFIPGQQVQVLTASIHTQIPSIIGRKGTVRYLYNHEPRIIVEFVVDGKKIDALFYTNELKLVGNVGTKPTNPKDALAIDKAPLSTLPTGPMYEVALAMLEGARKYGRHNYRVMGVKASVYYDAAMGHLTAFWEGEDIDPDSGLHHLAKGMACLAVLRDSMMMENWVDDRPPKYPNVTKLMRDNPLVNTILKKYPDCIKPYTENNKNDR